MFRGKDSIEYIIEKIQDERRLKPNISVRRNILNSMENDLNAKFKSLGDRGRIKGRFGCRLPFVGRMLHFDFYLPMKSLPVIHRAVPDIQVVLFGIDLSKYNKDDVVFVFDDSKLGNRIGDLLTSILFYTDDPYPEWNRLSTVDEREKYLESYFTKQRFDIDYIKASYPTLCDFFLDGMVPKGGFNLKTLNVRYNSMKDVSSGNTYFTGAFSRGFLDRVKDSIYDLYKEKVNGLYVNSENYLFMKDRKFLPCMAALLDSSRFTQLIDSNSILIPSVRGLDEKDYIYFVRLSSGEAKYKKKNLEKSINSCIPYVYIKGKGFGRDEVFNPTDCIDFDYKEEVGTSIRMSVDYNDWFC